MQKVATNKVVKVNPPAAKGVKNFDTSADTKKSAFANNNNVNANEADVAPTFVVEDENTIFPDDFSGNDFGEDASAKFTTFEEKPDGSQVEAGVEFEDDVVSSDDKATID